MKEKQIKFKPGDVVQLKTGGAEMVVIEYTVDPYSNKETDLVRCAWHDLLQNEQRGEYPENGLFKVEK